MKRLLFMEDLLSFYQTHFTESIKFSSEDSGPIIVQTKGKIKFSENKGIHDGLTPVTIVSSHIGKNRNGSCISQETMERALPSFSNRPVLAWIHKPEGSDQYEFGGHAFHINENGETVYDEVPVGIVPESCNARLEKNEENGKTYAVVDAFIFDEYSCATEILTREEQCAVSVELMVKDLIYNAEEKTIEITDFVYSGVTILGKDQYGDEIAPGMEGANITLSAFSAENNSLTGKAGDNMMVNEQIANLNQDSEIEDHKDSSEDFVAATEKEKEDAKLTEDDMANEPPDNQTSEMETSENGTDEELDDNSGELRPDNSDDEEYRKSNNSFSVFYNVIINGETHTFEKSLNDKVCELSCLVDKVYGRAEETWYDTIVYDEYIIMQDYRNNKIYRQGYFEGEDGYQLDGERVEVTVAYVTEEEEAAIKAMKADYFSLVEYKNAAESAKLHDERQAIVGDAKYAAMSGTDEYKALVAEMDKYSLTELETKVKCLFADYVASGQIEVPQATNNKVMFGTNKKKSAGTYPSLFKSKR